MNHDSLNKLGRGSQKEPSCQVILKSVQWCLTRRFLNFFLFRYIGKISPTPWQPCFLTNHDCLYNLGRGSPKQHSSQVILKLVMGYVTRRILKFSMQIYTKNKPHPLWGPWFLTYHESLNNLGRRSPKQHSCQVTLNSVQLFLTRRF